MGQLHFSAGQTFVAADARRSRADLWEYQQWAPGVAQQWQKCRILMSRGLPVVTFPLVSHWVSGAQPKCKSPCGCGQLSGGVTPACTQLL